VAREKKGEFLDVFAEMQAQGYVRFRVNGKTYEFDDLPTLKKTEKHDIDVVIDRIKVRPDLQQRLAESFEAALRLANGRAIALEMDTPDHSENDSALRSMTRPTALKSTYLTPSLPARCAATRLASWSRACSRSTRRWVPAPACDGLGQQDFFDPARVVAFPTLSLASGAIKGWDRRNGYYFAMLESLAAHYGLTSSRPLNRCQTGAAGGAARLGRGRNQVQLHGLGANAGQKLTKKHPFEGIIPNMAAALPRDRLGPGARRPGPLPQHPACPDCAGSRLRREAATSRLARATRRGPFLKSATPRCARALTIFRP
jgi:excinuclease ABC subunit A